MKVRDMDKFKKAVYDIAEETPWLANADWNKLLKEIDILDRIQGISLEDVINYIKDIINYFDSKGNNIIETAEVELVDCPEILKIIKMVIEQR